MRANTIRQQQMARFAGEAVVLITIGMWMNILTGNDTWLKIAGAVIILRWEPVKMVIAKVFQLIREL